MGTWILYIDESGEFEKQQTCIAGGVLLDVSDKVVDVAVLKAALIKCYPLMPWPLHATDARRPMAHVVGAMLQGRTRVPALPELSTAVQYVRDAKAGDLALVRRSVEQRKMPGHQVLDGALAEVSALSASVASALSVYEHERRLASYRLMRALGSTLRGKLFTVGAVSAPGVDYPRVFGRCVHRALGFLRRAGAAQPSLRLTVAVREKSRGVLFTRGDLLEWAAEGAIMTELLETPRPDVELSADEPKHMTPAVTTWLVVADLVCNRLLQPVRTSGTWKKLEEHGGFRLGLPLCMKPRRLERRLPTLDFVAAEDERAPGWARQQAAMWQAAAQERS